MRSKTLARPLISTVFLVLSLFIWQLPAFAGTAPTMKVFFTNDVHTQVQPTVKDNVQTNAGYAQVEDYINKNKGLGPYLLVDDGDAIQGGPLGSMSKGGALIEIMTAMGYRYSAVGNHEFDYGMERFLELKDSARANGLIYLSSNFRHKGNLVLPDKDVQAYGVTPAENDTDSTFKLAFVGVSTPETLFKSAPASFMDQSGNYVYSFDEDSTGEKLYASVQTSVDAARAEGADMVILLAHLGEAGSTTRWRSDELIKHTTGIDVVLDGHSHEAYVQTVQNKNGQNVYLAQTGTKLQNLGELSITPTAAEPISIRLIPARELREEDSTIKAKVNELVAANAEALNRKIGESLVDLGSADKTQPRIGETNSGDFIADAYKAQTGADIALVNGGGVRSIIPKGDVTFKNLLAMQPFSNELTMIEAKGSEILDALELGARLYPEPSGGFLQVAGLTYKIDPTVASTVEVDDHGGFVRVAGARRVYDVMVAGKAIDPETTYKVAGVDFMLRKGGDGYSMFSDNKVLLEAAKLDVEAVENYLKNNLGATIGLDYEKAQGRIVIAKPEPKAEEKPATEPTKAPVKTEVVKKSLPRTADEQNLAWAVVLLASSSVLVIGLKLKTKAEHV